MSICRSLRVASWGLVGLLLSVPIVGASEVSPLSGVVVGGVFPSQLVGASERPRLYDNMEWCTSKAHAIALGGQPPNPMQPLDWFTTAGGDVTGFDLLVLNGSSLEQSLTVQFYIGTNSQSHGTPDSGAFFRTLGQPPISRIPPWVDPFTGDPGIVRVRVDYTALTYLLTGLSVDPDTGEPVETPLNGGGEFLGEGPGRLPFALPVGEVGVAVRFGNEPSICNGGDPQAGPVLAGGGSGNEDGHHILGIYSDFGFPNCSVIEFPNVCGSPGWMPFQNVPCNDDADCEDVFGPDAFCQGSGVCFEQASVPCEGGDLCALDLPHNGIALTLYAGPDEDDDGNNELDSADVIAIDPPDPCTSGLVTVHSFLGDNGQPIAEPVVFFDCNGDGDVGLPDVGCFQLCFGSSPSGDCRIHDSDQDGDVDLDDFGALLVCADDGAQPGCTGTFPPVIQPLQDVDIFAVRNLTPGYVVSAVVEGESSPFSGPLWDPYLRLFAETGSGVEALGFCDDFYRFNLDAFMTAEVPPGADTIYVAISSEVNAEYDPQDPSTIVPLGGGDAGGYALTLAVTDPNCVEDDGSGGAFECVVGRHEPDDSLSAADARGPTGQIFYGAIGDGAFAELGQDVDIWRIQLDGSPPLIGTENTRSITVAVRDFVGGGFATAFDLVLALYDAEGKLIAVADQSARGSGFDEGLPQFGANVCGSAVSSPLCMNESPVPGVYYVAVFATDRQLFDLDHPSCDAPNETCPPLPRAIPPTILSFAHGDGVGCTNACDIRPTVPGRMNLPGMRIVGREPSAPPDPPNGPSLQCYRINMSTSTSLLAPTGTDADEQGPNGNDSIPDATADLVVADRLSGGPVAVRTLGNGRYGGHQGDVDFYVVNGAAPGDLVSLNISDVLSPEQGDNRVRSYLALFDQEGCVMAEEDYSLEHHETSPLVLDNISDELAATVVGTMPDDVSAVYAMVGVDAGSLDATENLPFDALRPGMTLAGQLPEPRPYFVSLSAIAPVEPLNTSRRMFAVVHRGIDDQHSEPFVGSPMLSTCARFPPVLEIDPFTGLTAAVLDGDPFFFTCRWPNPECQAEPDGCPPAVSAEPVIAYDGEALFVVVEVCTGGPPPCANVVHRLFRVHPDLEPGDAGFVQAGGDVFLGGAPGAVLTGMVELNGFLWALDATSHRFRFWDKEFPPDAANGGMSGDLTLLSGTDPWQSEFGDLDGDLGTDGESVYVGCSLDGVSVGICVFSVTPTPDGAGVDVVFVGTVDDPLTNLILTPGPRLGGLDFLEPGWMVTTDRNGPVVQHWDMNSDDVGAFEMPRGVLVDRISIR